MPMPATIPVEAQPNKIKWTVAKTLVVQTQNLMIFKAYIWFSEGCAGNVLVRVRRMSSSFLPNQAGVFKIIPPDPAGLGEYYSGNNVTFEIVCNQVMRKNEKYTIEYCNLDPSNKRKFSVQFDIRAVPANRSVDTEGTGTGRSPNTRTALAQQTEIDSTTGSETVPINAPGLDRPYVDAAKERRRSSYSGG